MQMRIWIIIVEFKLEIKQTLKRMEKGTIVDSNDIPIEVWKCMGEQGFIWLTKFFNEILRSKKMPDESRKGTLVLIFKNKGDIPNCVSYTCIKLISHTMKLYIKVIENRLRVGARIAENRFYAKEVCNISHISFRKFDGKVYK